jgi:hypothetical protein
MDANKRVHFEQWKATYTEVPELGRVWTVMNRLLRVFISSIVTQPHIEALLGENERESSLFVGQANPNFAA